MNQSQSHVAQQALHNAVSSISVANYAAIINGFTEKGIAEDDIKPRVNVFTYNAWRALGRQVRRGEHGVKVTTWVPMTKTDRDTGDKAAFKRPKTTTVFHVTQTDPIVAEQPSAPPPRGEQAASAWSRYDDDGLGYSIEASTLRGVANRTACPHCGKQLPRAGGWTKRIDGEGDVEYAEVAHECGAKLIVFND